ncbi:MAG: Holliday junction resolvase RuvX [Bacillota bacterium]
MRVLGVDYGSTRVGLAISDEAGAVAVPLTVLASTRDLSEQIMGIARENQVGLIVVGLPRNMDGSAGVLAQQVQELASELREHGFQVRLWDERLTTAQVERLLIEADVSRRKRKAVMDKLAACVMLQSFLDRAADH